MFNDYGYVNIVCVFCDYSLCEVDQKWLFICVGGNIVILYEIVSYVGYGYFFFFILYDLDLK